MGLTFKENCPDLRNTRVFEIAEQLQKYHAQIDLYDPWVDAIDAAKITLPLVTEPQSETYDLVVIAVAHDQFSESNPRAYLKSDGVLFDLKGQLPDDWVDERL